MRVENHIHIRHIMLYHYEKGWKAAQSFRDLNELFGEGTITDSAVRKWFARFKSGDTSLEDKEGRGRPSDFDDQALLTAVEEDESLTTRMLAADFNVDQSTIVRRLKKLGKVWKLAGWVPHELSDNNRGEKTEQKEPQRSITITHVHMLSAGSSNSSPIRAGIYSHIRRTHRPKHRRTITSTAL